MLTVTDCTLNCFRDLISLSTNNFTQAFSDRKPDKAVAAVWVNAKYMQSDVFFIQECFSFFLERIHIFLKFPIRSSLVTVMKKNAVLYLHGPGWTKNFYINPFLFIKNKQLFISTEGFSILEKNAVICSQRAMLTSSQVWQPFADSIAGWGTFFIIRTHCWGWQSTAYM